MNKRPSFASIAGFVATNALVLGVVAYAYVLESGYADLYYASVQEDEYLEWATFWAFLLAAVIYVRRGYVDRRPETVFPWFLYGVALFCFVVAMEEISWGQRILGYRPPVYFLENNFQQEFNFHNVVATDLRKLALKLVIVGYGVLLPVAALFSFPRRLFARVGIVAPAITLLPAFVATFLLYEIYPWGHSGEWVELMLGLGFLFGAVLMPRGYAVSGRPTRSNHVRSMVSTAIAFVVVMALGLVFGAFSRIQRDALPENLQAARLEAEALARDFESRRAQSKCNLHKRLYTFVEEYGQTNLYKGSFASLQAQGLPEERADFFLDPWNSPYWLRDRCDRRSNQRVMFVYSFGPNRQRESMRTEIRGDDIGAYITVR